MSNSTLYDPHDAHEQAAELRPVQLDAVERELDNLWRDANARIAATAAHAIARNSVLTLVLFTQRRADAEQLLRAVHSLTTQHPSRAVAVSADPQQQGDAIQSYIGTYVDSASYGEDILIEAQAGAVKHLPSVVLPLIVPGLPSFLLWTGEPPWGSELLESLMDGSDRLIVDTSEMVHIERSFAALDDLQHRKGTRCAISDTSWTAQGPWREIVAQFFDAPDVRAYLAGVEQLTIEYAAGDEDAPTNNSQAYLFAGWLASRLGWRSQQAPSTGLPSSRQHILRDSNGRLVTVEITAAYNVSQRTWWSPEVSGETLNAGERSDFDQEGRPWVRTGALISVYIASRLEGQRATFTIARERDLAHVTTACQVPGIAIPSQRVHLHSVGPQHPLTTQLQTLGRDAIYEEALGVATQLLNAGPRRGSA
jgi:glucose-6-phosphate dehydrogenase assembly protein OpcA